MKKVFSYGDLVVVRKPGRRAFSGTYYSEYRNHPNSERLICVQEKDGCGVAYRVRYVTLAKRQPRPDITKAVKVREKRRRI